MAISTRITRQKIDTCVKTQGRQVFPSAGGIIGMGESEEDRIGLLMSYACNGKSTGPTQMHWLPLEELPKDQKPY